MLGKCFLTGFHSPPKIRGFLLEKDDILQEKIGPKMKTFYTSYLYSVNKCNRKMYKLNFFKQVVFIVVKLQIEQNQLLNVYPYSWVLKNQKGVKFLTVKNVSILG